MEQLLRDNIWWVVMVFLYFPDYPNNDLLICPLFLVQIQLNSLSHHTQTFISCCWWGLWHRNFIAKKNENKMTKNQKKNVKIIYLLWCKRRRYWRKIETNLFAHFTPEENWYRILWRHVAFGHDALFSCFEISQ